jgi:hypothetical protein
MEYALDNQQPYLLNLHQMDVFTVCFGSNTLAQDDWGICHMACHDIFVGIGAHKPRKYSRA